jgi:hypothetical protein
MRKGLKQFSEYSQNHIDLKSSNFRVKTIDNVTVRSKIIVPVKIVIAQNDDI